MSLEIDEGRARSHRALAVAFGLVVVFMVVEIVAGFWTGSLALLSDAGHMATDALGMGMALAAIHAARRAASKPQHTYGLYRLEILAALANAVLLFAVGGYVLVEAAGRLSEPPDVLAGPMLAVAAAGLAVNVVSWRLLRSHSRSSLNVEGALLEVVADLFGSIGVIVAALLLRFTGWSYADPLFGAVIGVFILPRAWRLAAKALRVLLQAAPHHLDIDSVRSRLATLPGVADVHDLHVWTLTSEMDVASVHLVTAGDIDPHPVLDAAGDMLQEEFGIAHATLQVEPQGHDDCAEATW